MHSPFSLPHWLQQITAPGSDARGTQRSPAPASPRLESIRKGLDRYRCAEPELSILLPLRNDAASLLLTLESLSRQELSCAAEIIVVDNNSSDGSAALAARCGLSIFHERRAGLSYTRQTALERARGRYVLCTDAETLYPPGWAAKMQEILKENPEISCIYGSYRFIPESSYPYWKLSIYRFLSDPIQSFRAARNEFSNIMGFNMGFRRLDALRAGGFPGEEEMDRRARRETEFGRLALRLSRFGRLHYTDELETRAWTSARTLQADGGLLRAAIRRLGRELLRPFGGQRKIVVE